MPAARPAFADARCAAARIRFAFRMCPVQNLIKTSGPFSARFSACVYAVCSFADRDIPRRYAPPALRKTGRYNIPFLESMVFSFLCTMRRSRFALSVHSRENNCWPYGSEKKLTTCALESYASCHGDFVNASIYRSVHSSTCSSDILRISICFTRFYG